MKMIYFKREILKEIAVSMIPEFLFFECEKNPVKR